MGCGTGLSLSLLRQGVGHKGRIVGIEQSPEMVEQARRRVARARWARVTLLCSPVETADIRARADAALFHFTHDILQRPEAIANVISHLRPGARVVASGLKWAAPWLMRPINLFVLPAALRSVTSLDGMDRPWRLLQDQPAKERRVETARWGVHSQRRLHFVVNTAYRMRNPAFTSAFNVRQPRSSEENLGEGEESARAARALPVRSAPRTCSADNIVPVPKGDSR